MKIAIISDIHDNLMNLKKFLSLCQTQRIEVIICCGDIANSETLKYLANNFSGNIYLIKGNAEIYQEEEIDKYKNIKYFGKYGRFELADKTIGFCHEPDFIDNIMSLGDCDVIFHGHTHKPWTEEKKGVKIYNPGTLGGVFQKATFAVWETNEKEFELKILERL